MKRKIICAMSIILVISLLSAGCDNTDSTPTPSPTLIPTSAGTPEPTTSPSPQIKEGSPDLNSKPGDIYEIGRSYWDWNDINVGNPLFWEILEIKDGNALMILKSDLDNIPENFNLDDMKHDNVDFLEWLNLYFFAENFPYNYRYKWGDIRKTIRDIGSTMEEQRFFLLNPQEIEQYFPNETNENILKPAMWYALDYEYADRNAVWEVELDYFIYFLKTKNIYFIMNSLGVYSQHQYQDIDIIFDSGSPFYKFLLDAEIIDVNVISKELNEYESGYEYVIDIIVSQTDTEYFEVGSNLFDIHVEASEGNSITYFAPQSSVVEVIDRQSQEPNLSAYKFFVHFMGHKSYDTDDLDDLNDLVTNKEMDETAYIGFVSDLVRFLPTLSDPTYSVDELSEMTEKLLGIEGVDFSMHPSYDEESESVIIQGMGGVWFFMSSDNVKINHQTGETTLDISVYSDAAYVVVARKYSFVLTENEDGTFKIKSVKKTYDTGVQVAFGVV